MNLQEFKAKLKEQPEAILFNETIEVIDSLYDFTPTEFKNGDTLNESGQNNGSCKLFAFAVAENLTKEETLASFGQFYFEDVLKDPNGDGHQNIRNFMTYGFEGLDFKGEALVKK